MSETERIAASTHSEKVLAGKYLTFALGKEQYGIGILKVREIIGVMEITVVPHTPHYVKGVINLRGRVIPVLDLRLKFGMEAKKYNERTCVIVVDLLGSAGPVQVGMLVDSVSEVVNVGEQEIEPPPSFGGSEASGADILGMAKVKGAVIILLDVDQVIGIDRLEGSLV
ncbi:MAG: chemotaxis protein CheW [Deltaproteobacteria bacterium RIFOXYD12_FULL_50_9]|nr:MAG: chemotaxis protein CheW [Deltaproteobacteria bacterium RIFOXYD12_FULL_50_9]